MYDKDSKLIYEAYASKEIITENIIQDFKQKVGEFTAKAIEPYLKKSLEGIKKSDPAMYNEIIAAVAKKDKSILQKIRNAAGESFSGIQNEDFKQDMKSFAGELGKSVYAGGKEAIQTTHNFLGKKLGEGKRGMLYILLLGLTAFFAYDMFTDIFTNISSLFSPPSTIEGFEDAINKATNQKDIDELSALFGNEEYITKIGNRQQLIELLTQVKQKARTLGLTKPF